MAKFSLVYKVPGRPRSARVEHHKSEFERNTHAAVLGSMGYKVRKLKPKRKTV